MFEILFSKVEDKIKLSDIEKDICKSLFSPKKLRKRQYILQHDDICKNLVFVEKGILRSYSVDSKGNEHILQFAPEGWWISDVYSFLTGEAAVYNIEAIEDSELLLISRSSLDELYERVPKFERYFRLLSQANMVATHRRLTASLSDSADEKYLRLLSAYPNIVARVPQHMIASYLGITPETLSRVRKRIVS
ncbi:MAG: cyclic nucleotide-binding protein [Sphingobacteriales bacterium 17-39-43]|uniref:Crp/Fnr family transcriptional regulator n=1 Tax=Daejeonella sp. TaxID=2805397 RepID=UPI000BC59147|nr:Crp/Fnr family transcriptional regulator [Daejeonella sp.]OYZ31190.1 MAG: cyclic nucleotide-binding protein [Sphingobacteriales bacterium 16-39-50]OYZ43753.1 MAG: cyclic nucleotide-binding protein [Sphingobacteriales bacterium 24-40-4]OZA24069.1 MAG: cyclic nucleotide-binding protein [Sphingobacteriales bacterium 17-39-43]HQS51826.1 Crp/Fnr family transcriptional regulator [Daejeonella sp.]HQT23241.1 Crp/Fnr family transcriptional regulator [Daejeonella sp.]